MSQLKVVNQLLDKFDVDIGPLNATFKNHIMEGMYWTEPGRWAIAERPIEAVHGYELFLLQNPQIIRAAKEQLTGKVLGCFCAPKGGLGPDDPIVCHGQYLLRAIRGDYN